MVKYHVAARGQKAGQWVKCVAKNVCRISSEADHIGSRLMADARMYKQMQNPNGYVAISTMTQQDVDAFNRLTVHEKANVVATRVHHENERRKANIRKHPEVTYITYKEDYEYDEEGNVIIGKNHGKKEEYRGTRNNKAIISRPPEGAKQPGRRILANPGNFYEYDTSDDPHLLKEDFELIKKSIEKSGGRIQIRGAVEGNIRAQYIAMTDYKISGLLQLKKPEFSNNK